jgi:glycosyltransferase A (GT-A) superfamily protein (DUF2064 family)
VTPAHLAVVTARLDSADAVLGPAADGGWWVLGLRDPAHAIVLNEVQMSTVDTGVSTAAALRARGLCVAYAEPLRDVDTATDAHVVARSCPGGRFAAAVRTHVAAPAEVRP